MYFFESWLQILTPVRQEIVRNEVALTIYLCWSVLDLFQLSLDHVPFQPGKRKMMMICLNVALATDLFAILGGPGHGELQHGGLATMACLPPFFPPPLEFHLDVQLVNPFSEHRKGWLWGHLPPFCGPDILETNV